VLLLMIMILWLVPKIPLWHHSEAYLEVTFLDVGQGDAILIETPDGVDVLIDGGPDAAVLRELSSALGPFDRTIDMVIGTHPDKDHIAGLVDVLSRYKVTHIMTTENRGETMVATSYQTALVHEGATVDYARAGQVYALGASTTLTIFSPASDPSMLESNTASIVAKLSYGDIDFMLTGDAPVGIEDYISGMYGELLRSEVLKLGHHGSRTSTSDLFLATVQPQFAVVSAGADNRYGHPHSEVVERVEAANVILQSTAQQGRIEFQSDGTTVWIKK
jgi:competence protein ComEC